MSDTPTEPKREPHFRFDVWQCKKCGLIVGDAQYKAAAYDYECNCGQRLSTFRFVAAEGKSHD